YTAPTGQMGEPQPLPHDLVTGPRAPILRSEDAAPALPMISPPHSQQPAESAAMLALPRRSFTTAAIALGLLALFPAAGAQTRVDDTALAGALRAGGHIILMRHGATNPDQEDADPLNFDNIAGQRQ